MFSSTNSNILYNGAFGPIGATGPIGCTGTTGSHGCVTGFTGPSILQKELRKKEDSANKFAYENKKFCDKTIILLKLNESVDVDGFDDIGEEKLDVNSLIISQCEYFKTLLQSTMNETESDQIKYYVESLDEANNFKQIIKYMYFGHFDNEESIKYTQIIDLLIMANKLQFTKLVDYCVLWLDEVMNDVERVSLVNKGKLYDFEAWTKLIDLQFVHLKKNYLTTENFWKSVKFLNLNFDSVCKFFKMENVHLCLGNNCYFAMIHWLLESDYSIADEISKNENKILELLDCIDFNYFDEEFLKSINVPETCFNNMDCKIKTKFNDLITNALG